MEKTRIAEAVAYIREQTDLAPEYAIVLGTGLHQLAEAVLLETRIPYEAIPHFPVSTVDVHRGELLFGHLGPVPVVVMSGRFHYYEGYSAAEIVFPVRVFRFLGVKALLLSNAVGSVNERMEEGDIVFIRDHINLLPGNPLRGISEPGLGPRFPDLSGLYDHELRREALGIAEELGIRAHEGVLAILSGPNLETPAEYNFIHFTGADLVGMSSIPSAIVAKQMDLPVLISSVVTDKAYPIETIRETNLEDVVRVSAMAGPKLSQLFQLLIQRQFKRNQNTHAA